MDGLKEQLNDIQYDAVTSTEGAVLVLAGAGTGKTRVITYRIAYLVKSLGVSAGNILAVTFTNKAAGEMKERLNKLIGQQLASALWLGTFHSICLTILRRDGEKIGLEHGFGIVDQEDRLNIVRSAMKRIDLDVKKYSPKQYLHAISAFKNTSEYVEARMPVSDTLIRFTEVWRFYQQELAAQRMIDFDDMLSLAVRLFVKESETLREYREMFRYILVDEYQDTNAVQFKLLYLLSGRDGNLCVVGDDDQSIYGWRGAEIRNILEFDGFFDNVKEIKLVGNYRSGGDILNIANTLISKNMYRRGKTLNACRDEKGNVKRLTFTDERMEAEYAASVIASLAAHGEDLSTVAILYRTNAQSRNFEVALNKLKIPYKVIGGTGFYQRREIKDVLSYLRVFDNVYDVVSFRRSLKNPPRGIGDTTLDKITSYASERGIGMLTALSDHFDIMGRTKAAVERYLDLMEELGKTQSLRDKIDCVIERTAYKEYLKQFEEPDEAERRLDNVMELYSAAAAFEEQNPQGGLADFLANTALVTSDEDDTRGVVKLMTMHAAKGLEFRTVFLTGLEDGLFPLGGGEEGTDLEEERRLCYVGVTRAMDQLHITNVQNRLRFGRREMSKQSRFIEEMFGKGGVSIEPRSMSQYGTGSAGLPNDVPKRSENRKFEVSDKVTHNVFGDGIVLSSEGAGAAEKVTVQFKKSGIKKILAGFLAPRS